LDDVRSPLVGGGDEPILRVGARTAQAVAFPDLWKHSRSWLDSNKQPISGEIGVRKRGEE
jgi:hypothetical protein